MDLFSESVASMGQLAATIILIDMVYLRFWCSRFLGSVLHVIVSIVYQIQWGIRISLLKSFCTAINPPIAAISHPIVATQAAGLNIGVIDPAASIYQTLAQPTVHIPIILYLLSYCFLFTPWRKRRKDSTWLHTGRAMARCCKTSIFVFVCLKVYSCYLIFCFRWESAQLCILNALDRLNVM